MAAKDALSRQSFSSASLSAVARRGAWRDSAPRPPNDRGDWMPDASPAWMTRSNCGARGELRYVANAPNNTRSTTKSDTATPWYAGRRRQYSSIISARDGLGGLWFLGGWVGGWKGGRCVAAAAPPPSPDAAAADPDYFTPSTRTPPPHANPALPSPPASLSSPVGLSIQVREHVGGAGVGPTAGGKRFPKELARHGRASERGRAVGRYHVRAAVVRPRPRRARPHHQADPVRLGAPPRLAHGGRAGAHAVDQQAARGERRGAGVRARAGRRHAVGVDGHTPQGGIVQHHTPGRRLQHLAGALDHGVGRDS